MNRARRVAGFAAVASGFGAASLLGWPVGPVALGGLILCAAGPWLAPRLAAAPWPLVTLAVLLGLGGWVSTGAPPRAALGMALVYLQVHRVLGRTGPSDDRVALLLSGLMLVAAASASEEVAWLGCFLPWCLSLSVALLPAGFRVRSAAVGRMVAGTSVGTLVLVAVLFPALPRVRTERPDPASALTGFSPEVELGTLDVLLDDPEEVFRVEAAPGFPKVPLYFRGAVLDRFDGHTWTSSGPGDRTLLQPPDRYPGDAVVLRFSGEAPDGALFTAGQVLHVESSGRPLRRDRHGAWRMERSEGPTEWLVVARGPWGPGSATGVVEPPRPDAYLQLPDELDPRVPELARAIRGAQTDPRRIADRVADSLRARATYSRAPRDAGSEAPLTTFLFDRRTGHCEYFASAQAVLLRAVGIQARVVNGFVAGEPLPGGPDRVVRRYHAHAWAEVWVPGEGWVLIDATPGPGAPAARTGLASLGDRLRSWWRDDVVSFDRTRQRTALWSAGAAVEGVVRPREPRAGIPWMGLTILWVLALGLVVLAERLLRRVGARLAGELPGAPRGRVDRAWQRARAAAEREVGTAPRSLPPLSVARWLSERRPSVAPPLEELAWLLYRVHHGGEAEELHVERARQLAQEVVRALQARATG